MTAQSAQGLVLLVTTVYLHLTGLGTCVDVQPLQSSSAITRLSTQLGQLVQEKNDILAQFFGQQSLIKEQQVEIKGLLRCKAENVDLQAQISGLNKTINVSKYQRK